MPVAVSLKLTASLVSLSFTGRPSRRLGSGSDEGRGIADIYLSKIYLQPSCTMAKKFSASIESK
jgi:hypothetical protein